MAAVPSFVVTTKEKAKREKLAIFRDWILARARAESAAERGAGSA